MIPYIIMIVSFLLDGILSNFLPFQVNNLSLFTPCLTVTSILLIFPFYRKQEQKYLITVFVLGILYDLFYTNLLFFNGVLFTFLGFLLCQFHNRKINIGIMLIGTIGIIVCYEGITGLLLGIYQVVPITFQKVFYKITHSLLLNVIYTGITYGIIKLLPKKYKTISIN